MHLPLNLGKASMFTRIIDFVKYRGYQIEIQVVRDACGAISFGIMAPGIEGLSPVDSLGPFDTPEQALAAVRKWVWDWAARYYG